MQVLVQRNRTIKEKEIEEIRHLLTAIPRISVKEIAISFHITPSTVYYWAKKIGVRVKGRGLIAPRTAQRGASRTYYSYVAKANREGRMTAKEKVRAMNTFYRNRNKRFEEFPIVEPPRKNKEK